MSLQSFGNNFAAKTQEFTPISPNTTVKIGETVISLHLLSFKVKESE